MHRFSLNNTPKITSSSLSITRAYLISIGSLNTCFCVEKRLKGHIVIRINSKALCVSQFLTFTDTHTCVTLLIT